MAQKSSVIDKEMQSKKVLLPLFFTVFLDLLGGGLAIPIMPDLLLEPTGGVLPFEMDRETRTLIFGFLGGIFFLAQFLGAPILGAISDRDGRKKVLLMSLAGTLVGYLLFALGIYIQNIYLLFFSRAVAGFMGGNISVALSAISDVSDESNKTRNFGLVGAAFGLGFIFGPFLGGKLADANTISWFNLMTPFLVAAILTGINMILVVINLPETLKERRERKVTIFTGLENISNAFQHANLRTTFLTVFFITFGFSLFTQFFSVFLKKKFQMDMGQIGMIFGYVGVWSVISQAAFLRPLSKKFHSLQILKVSLLLLSILMIVIILPPTPFYYFFIIPFVAISQGMTQPNINTIVTNQAAANEQGQMLGINQSVQSLAMAIPPMIAGFLSNIDMRLPNIGAAICMFIGWALLYFVLGRAAR